MRAIFITIFGFFSLSEAAHAGAEQLAWLSGRWCGTQNGEFNEETWMTPRAGSLVGMHRDSKGGQLTGFEFFRIVEEGTTLVYWTQPSGKSALPFRATRVEKDKVSFVNDAHDFPTRIIYQRLDADTLRARIDDGSDHGRSFTWTWKKCGP